MRDKQTTTCASNFKRVCQVKADSDGGSADDQDGSGAKVAQETRTSATVRNADALTAPDPLPQKKDRFRMSLQSRRGSKVKLRVRVSECESESESHGPMLSLRLQERFSDDAKEGRSKTLPSSRKSSKVAN